MLIDSIAFALVYGFFLFEWTGLVAGGLIAPAYFALYLNQIPVLVLSLAIALLTMFLVRLLASATILYGRRRFILSILIAFALQYFLGSKLMSTELAQGQLAVVGYLIPGLLAHEMGRQGVIPSLLALLLLTCLVRLSLWLLITWQGGVMLI